MSGEGIPLMELTPESTSKFYIKGFGISLEFVKEASGNAMRLVIHQNGKHVIDAVRI